MSNAALEAAIETAWESRDSISPATKGETRDAIGTTLSALDSGKLRGAGRQADGKWHVNQWAKKAVLLSFRLTDNGVMPFGEGDTAYGYDKRPLTYAAWAQDQFAAAGPHQQAVGIVHGPAGTLDPGPVLRRSLIHT